MIIILIMMKFQYLVNLQNTETHLPIITLDYMFILKVKFNIYVERI